MTESIYKQTKLVQLTPAGEWYVAIPHPGRPNVLAVDTGKNLTFAAEFEPATLATVQPVLALNRFVDLRLEFIPGLLEGSAFNLLANRRAAAADQSPQPAHPADLAGAASGAGAELASGSDNVAGARRDALRGA